MNHSTLQNAWEDNNDSEHGPSVPNSMLTCKGKLINVQNLTCSKLFIKHIRKWTQSLMNDNHVN